MPTRAWRPLALIAVLVTALLLPPWQPASAAAPEVTLDSHEDGDAVPVGMVRLAGTYTDAFGLSIVIDGDRTPRVHTVAPAGGESGDWHYDLDTTEYDGEIEVAVRASRSDTRYGVWSPAVRLRVDNAAASAPQVTVTSPADGSTVRRPTVIKADVSARNPVREVSVRINGGQWQRARGDAGNYVLPWDPRSLGDAHASIEVRAIDARGNLGHSQTTYVQVGNGAAEPVVVVPQDRAMWIWERASYHLLVNPNSRELLKVTAQDTDTFDSQPITTLYFGVDRYAGVDLLKEYGDEVRDFVRWAHAEGFEVHALVAGGTQPPFLGGLERYHSRAVGEMEKVLNYNLASAPDERFVGINVDIEPYIHPSFNPTRPALQQQWLEILEKMMQRRDAAGSGIMFGPAIPRWLDTSDCCVETPWKGVTKPLSEHIQDMVDYISIMDYRDTADGGAGIIAQAANEIAYAEAIGKPNSVVIGVETLDIAWSGDPEVITFREEGRAVAERELRKVYDAFKDSPAFGGVAMHHYDSIRWLPSVWGPNAVYTPLPPDAGPPTAVSSPPVATTFDHQSIELGFGRASDDVEVEHYHIYRSTDPGFSPGPSNLAAESRNLTFHDVGLLPETTYHYRVAAVDVHGNVGPASAVASATTGATDLRPLIVDDLTVTGSGGPATVRVRVVDRATGDPMQVTVHGRFTKMAGNYLSIPTDSDGWATGNSENIGFRTGLAGFLPLRITGAAGYYWASAHDRVRNVEIGWEDRTAVVADAFVRGGEDAGSNFGSAPQLEIANFDAAEPDRLAYLRADLTDYPGVATVSARLHFYVSEVSPAGVPVTVRALTDNDWEEEVITWDDRPSDAGATTLATVPVNGPGWYSVDLTAAVNAQLAAGALSLQLADESASGGLLTIDSREGAHPPYVLIY